VSTITAIAWTDHTFNPWWGCTKIVGPNGAPSACDHCYAETFAKRTGHAIWGKEAPRRFFGDKHWAEPMKWNRQAEAEGRRHRVFCASMADVFEPRVDLDPHRERLFRLTEHTPWLDWQLLTKRPEQVHVLAGFMAWPDNVWIGTTVENQHGADLRIPRLLEIEATTRFLSCEPLLGPVRLGEWGDRIDWVICGGESGPHHRPMNLDHARDLRDQCMGFGIPFFFKQVGGRTPTAGGDLLDGEQWKQFPGRRG
jgi:protein gp37